MNKTKDINPITPAVFYILLALYGTDRHGYDIMRQIKEDSHGVFTMGPGTLYGSIDRMMSTGLLERLPSENTRRIYYRLTAKGKKVLQTEVDRISQATQTAVSKKLKVAFAI